jgi:hypothetical protein
LPCANVPGTRNRACAGLHHEGCRRQNGIIIVTDPQGKTVQINRQLVVALFELPELKPPTSVFKAYELRQFTSLQATLAKLNAASPKIKIALAPYQEKFDAVVKPEIDKFQSGNVKIKGLDDP